jgi:GNAT superfamily N-acetyltransferase
MRLDIHPITEREEPGVSSCLVERPRAMHLDRLRAQSRQEFMYLIAWAYALPVGHVGVVWPGDRNPSEFRQRYGCAEVSDLFVAPTLRRRGIGRALMARLEHETRERRIPAVGLATGLDDGYRAARALYRSLGYRRVSGPFIQSSRTPSDDGHPRFWIEVLTYWLKELV